MEAPGRSDPWHTQSLSHCCVGWPTSQSQQRPPGWASTPRAGGWSTAHTPCRTQAGTRHLPSCGWGGDNNFPGTGKPFWRWGNPQACCWVRSRQPTHPLCLALLHPSRVSCTQEPSSPFSLAWFSRCGHLFLHLPNPMLPLGLPDFPFLLLGPYLFSPLNLFFFGNVLSPTPLFSLHCLVLLFPPFPKSNTNHFFLLLLFVCLFTFWGQGK